mgnify:CR=1 FL=1|jgi:hypothetical protein
MNIAHCTINHNNKKKQFLLQTFSDPKISDFFQNSKKKLCFPKKSFFVEEVQYEQQQRSLGGWFDHHASSAMASICIEYMVNRDDRYGVDRDRDTKYVNELGIHTLTRHTPVT